MIKHIEQRTTNTECIGHHQCIFISIFSTQRFFSVFLEIPHFENAFNFEAWIECIRIEHFVCVHFIRRIHNDSGLALLSTVYYGLAASAYQVLFFSSSACERLNWTVKLHKHSDLLRSHHQCDKKWWNFYFDFWWFKRNRIRLKCVCNLKSDKHLSSRKTVLKVIPQKKKRQNKNKSFFSI